jgi:hypothetical protein
MTVFRQSPTRTLPSSLRSAERGTSASRFVAAVGPGTTQKAGSDVVAPLPERQRGEGAGGALPRRARGRTH